MSSIRIYYTVRVKARERDAAKIDLKYTPTQERKGEMVVGNRLLLAKFLPHFPGIVLLSEMFNRRLVVVVVDEMEVRGGNNLLIL